MNDPMYGKPHVIKQLDIPGRYYSFQKLGWHFVILDSNNEKSGSLDEEQRQWLEEDLAKLPAETPVLCMSHYPILSVSTILDGGNHTDSKYITSLFYKHHDKKITCISGHIHLQDAAEYNGVQYYCNGALSGFWWEDGDKDSAGKCYYHETPPGYAILDLFEDGTVENQYIPHSF
jgi:3',5'-cyclic AMP phosphodiesterase CpdA